MNGYCCGFQCPTVPSNSDERYHSMSSKFMKTCYVFGNVKTLVPPTGIMCYCGYSVEISEVSLLNINDHASISI
jgi:hypothetical protein